MVLFGSQAAGALTWGLIAEHSSLIVTFLLAAVSIMAGAATLRFWPLFDTDKLRQDRSVHWPEPSLVIKPEPDAGPILVTTTYAVAPERELQFLQAMRAVRLSRLRTGAIWWELYRDGETAHRFTEAYALLSWEEHLRQHHDRPPHPRSEASMSQAHSLRVNVRLLTQDQLTAEGKAVVAITTTLGG
jgi:Transmembrane secretion effector